jgi:ABC-type uncharacterized transport system ATPase subunit
LDNNYFRERHTGADDGSIAASLTQITKSFYGAVANDGIDFELKWGEVHALLGENGAGKSTLCSILAGLYVPDSGNLRLDGETVHLGSPHAALDRGVGMVYQHFRLVDRFTVAENIVLGHPDTPFALSRTEIERRVLELADRYRIPVFANALVWQLSVGEQQRVEILKLLYRGVRVLILDEPTAVLTPQEARNLFTTVRAMADEGKAVVFVSHKLDEVMDVSDRITVLRDGKNVGPPVMTAEADVGSLARMMIGRDLRAPQRGNAVAGDVLLSISELIADGDRGIEAIRGVNLEVRSGEIVGLAGVSGNGQRELAEVISGLRTARGGRVFLGEVDITRLTVLERIKLGMGFVPEDRLNTGLAGGLSLAANLSLKAYRGPPLSRGPFVSNRAVNEHADNLIEQFDIRGARPSLPVSLLSGGNLQRAILAREISGRPRALVASAPTRGLDVASTHAIRKMLLDERGEGAAILMISEDLDELVAVCDVIVVFYEGRIIGRLQPDEVDSEVMGLLMAGHEVPPP